MLLACAGNRAAGCLGRWKPTTVEFLPEFFSLFDCGGRAVQGSCWNPLVVLIPRRNSAPEPSSSVKNSTIDLRTRFTPSIQFQPAPSSSDGRQDEARTIALPLDETKGREAG